MKPSSSWLMPASLVLCAVLVVGAMAWITFGTINTERERADAELRAVVQERTRLALWRMDSLGASILLEESAFPDAESRLPVKTRFAVSSKGELNSLGLTPSLSGFREVLDGQVLKTMCQITQTEPTGAPPNEVSRWTADDPPTGQTYNGYAPFDSKSQMAANQNEQAMRSKVLKSTLDNSNPWLNRIGSNSMKRGQSRSPSEQRSESQGRDSEVEATREEEDRRMTAPPSSGGVIPVNEADSEGSIALPAQADGVQEFVLDSMVGQPRTGWVNGMLILARRVGPGGDEVFDGAWIDAVKLRKILLAEASDLLVDAALVPAEEPGNDGMVLASFPFRLHVPAPSVEGVPLRSATVLSLSMSWAAVLIALLAILALVRGIMRLSERRASFVSAVTHELRTPLTTFRLYSDMLGSGAVKEERRGEYLRVLTREADRLTHLVENVLAFSRIERGNARSQVRTMEVSELLGEMRERFDTRLEAAGLYLVIDVPGRLCIRADRVAVEHILFNLIDNAAKYAVRSEPPVVTITASQHNGSVKLRICDHGPGIDSSEISRIFRPFHKSAREAAESKPGVGLGLALSRRLSRQQGGDLVCVGGNAGACFELSLPSA